MWVLLANGASLFFIFLITLDNPYGGFWFQFALRAAIPVLGIILEFVGSHLALWVNIGYSLFVVAALCRIFYLRGWFDLSLAYPIAATAVTCFLYSRWWLPGARAAYAENSLRA